MKNYNERDKKKRFLFLKFELTRTLLKSIIRNKYLTNFLREKAAIDLSKLPKNSSRVRIRNRCILTGRSRFIFSSFSISRLTFRKMALSGFIPGLRKASW